VRCGSPVVGAARLSPSRDSSEESRNIPGIERYTLWSVCYSACEAGSVGTPRIRCAGTGRQGGPGADTPAMGGADHDGE
jgi:hypothetical protein